MADAKVFYVDIDASGANDGTSRADAYNTGLHNALNSEVTDFSAAGGDYRCIYLNSGGSQDTVPVEISTTWNSGANKLIIEADSGYEALKTGWSSTRVNLSVSDDQNVNFLVGGNALNMEFIGIQFSCDGYSGDNQGCFLMRNSSTVNLYIDSCRIRENNADAGNYCDGIQVYQCSTTNIYVYNSIFEGFNNSNSAAIACYDADGTVVQYNSINYGGNWGLYQSAGSVTTKNCAIFNNSNDIQGTVTADYTASDDGDGTNPVAPSGADWDNEYTDSANGDFTLESGGNCEGGGTDDPGSGLYSVGMDGRSYTSPWSIGVDPKVAAGGLSIPVAVWHYIQQHQM